MSRIIPKLNLNKTPQLVENNSLVMAKNIRLLEDGTIGPDTSLEEIETKSGDSNEYDIHHDAVVEEETIYDYTILNFQSTISVIRDGNTLDSETIGDNAFDFNEYGHDEPEPEPQPNRFKYVRMYPDYPCHIHCYNHFGEELELVQERFLYSTNNNALIASNGYWLFVAVRQEIYNNTQEPINSLKRFYYVILPQSYNNFINGSPQTINIKKFNYVVLNPVYQISTIEQVVIHEAYDEHIAEYNTPKYIGQIVGLDNKIYFFREDIAIQYSQEARGAIGKKYPTECFVWETPSQGQEKTFDINDENYIIRKGELFEDREIAEELVDTFNNRAKIIEYDEVENTFKRIKCAWHYSGGKINGCVTVNNTGEYILSIVEYDVPDSKLVPIKHINLAKCKWSDDESQYTQAPNIPITNLILDDLYYKNIPSGVYQFFIRYKIHDNFYTNWFPCSKELFAGSKKRTNTLQGSLNHIDLHEDSNYSFIFTVNHLYTDYCKRFEEYQLGFIISSENGIFARSWKHFKMKSSNNSIIYFDYNKDDIQEINIDDLLKVNFDIFNVSNIVAFKNKLYISNYKETDFNENLVNYAKQIKVKIKLQDISFQGSSLYFNDIPLNESSEYIGIYDSFGVTNIKDTFSENNYCDIEDNETVVQGAIEDVPEYDPGYPGGGIIPSDYIETNYYTKITKIYIEYEGNNYYIFQGNEQIDDNLDNHNIIDNCIEEVKTFIIGIDSDGNYIGEINGTRISINNIKVEYISYTKSEFDNSIPGEDQYGIIYYGGWHLTPFIYTLTRTITLKNNIISNTLSTRVHKSYNTLLPFTKYDFYVHYIKQNGIVTNGYFICTKEVKRYCKGYVRTNLQSETYKDLDDIDNLDDISIYKSTDEDYARYYDNDLNDYIWFIMSEEDVQEKNILYPSFDNIICPPGYVGCFISVSKYGYNVAQGFNHVTDTKQEKHILDCLELDCLLYNVLNNITICNNKGVILTNDAIYYSSSTTNPVEQLGCSGHIEFNEYITENTKFWILFNDVNEPYNKTLIKLTSYIKLNINNPSSYDDYENVNSPGYFCEVRKLNRDYCDTLDVDNQNNPTGYYISGNDIYIKSREQNTNDLKLIEVEDRVDYHGSNIGYILSNFNLNYVSLTEDLNPIVRRFNIETENDNEEGEIINSEKQFITVVNSLICSFILELKSMFKDYTRKLYYEYTKNKLVEFNNTIRSSNVDVDEIYRYIYRFEATDYYNVPTQRGIITNLISIANSIYVHCEHSLFKFSDNKTLNAESEEVTLQENDIFNSGITEVFDAQYGYAGLKKREQSLITYNAYVFYDEVAKTVYAFGGEQQIGNISEPIKKLIKAINPTDVQFLGDEPRNRFFINFRNNLGNVCISFNFNSKSFVSVHDIDFKFGFHSRRNSYVVRENTYNNQITGWSIYKIIDVLRTELIRSDQPMPPDPSSFTYINNYIAYQNCYKKSLIHIADCDDNLLLNEVKSANACVDIICNTEYEAIKVLNYISWICSEIQQYGQGQNNVSEEIIDRHYPAHKIRIYSDSTETSLFELLDSNGNPKIANENSQYFDNGHQRANSRAWQYPQYNCGVWSMNYFRDVKNIEDVFDYKNPDNEIIGETGHETTVDLTPKITRLNLTQENSLLYGKYFVVRFIFNNKNFKLENVILKMNDYGKTK